jgi:hypothetical protein
MDWQQKIPCAKTVCPYQLRPFTVGWIAQLVEQRTENPRVGGSIPPPATTFPLSIPPVAAGLLNTSMALIAAALRFGMSNFSKMLVM